jgi:aminoglycoside phosphotransferase (APT) family kinase protein
MLAYWTSTETLGETDALTTVTGRPGYLTRDEIVDRYGRRSSRDVSNITFYEAFALFKIAVVIQQIYQRYRRGHTDDPRFATLASRVQALAGRAQSITART